MVVVWLFGLFSWLLRFAEGLAGEEGGEPASTVGDLVSRILAARRIAESDAGGFLDPSLKHLCDPS